MAIPPGALPAKLPSTAIPPQGAIHSGLGERGRHPTKLYDGVTCALQHVSLVGAMLRCLIGDIAAMTVDRRRILHVALGGSTLGAVVLPGQVGEASC